MYSGGRGTSVDKAAAIEWGRRAAEQGHQPGQLLLGRLLLESSDQATSEEGAQWLDRAAAAGNSQAALVLSAALARGENNLTKDELRAEQLVKPLADKGDVDAQFILAWLYTFADKFADRRALARDYLQKAVDGGHPHAAKALEELKAADKTN
jgi:TPR repeat protein